MRDTTAASELMSKPFMMSGTEGTLLDDIVVQGKACFMLLSKGNKIASAHITELLSLP